jgi:hypothetical protein
MRERGRPRHRWNKRPNTNMDFGELRCLEWTQLAGYRVQEWVFVMNIRIP